MHETRLRAALWASALVCALLTGACGGGGAAPPNRCASSATCPTGTVCVNAACVPAPALVISPKTISLSPGQTHTFQASGGVGTYSWALGPGATGAISANTGLYTAGATGTSDQVIVTDSLGSTANATVTLVPLAKITSFAATEGIVTEGETTKLTAVFTGGTASIDQGVGTVTSGTAATITIGGAATTYTLTVTNPLGVQAQSQVTVQSVAAPVITAFTATPASLISSATPQQAQLSATFANGVGVITPGNTSMASGSNVQVTPANTTTYTLTVTNAATRPTSVIRTVKVGVARAIAIARGNEQAATVKTLLPNPLVVKVSDLDGNGVANIGVKFTNWYNYYGSSIVDAQGAEQTDLTLMTDAAGEAGIRFRTGTYAGAGAYSVQAGVDNLQDAPAVSFSASGTPGLPESVQPQIAAYRTTAGNAVYTPPAVTVLDQYNNGVPGVSVRFAVTAGGGYLYMDGGAQVLVETAISNASGVASATDWVIGGAETNTPDNVVRASLVANAAKYADITSTGEITPTGTLAASVAQTRLGNGISFSGSFVNSADGGNQRIDRQVVDTLTDNPFSAVQTRAAFIRTDPPYYSPYFDGEAQKQEKVTYSLILTNGATPPLVQKVTTDVEVLDTEWTLTRIADSTGVACRDPASGASVTCTPSATGQDGAVATHTPAYTQADGSSPIVDGLTGLQWSHEILEPMAWSDAVTSCRALGAEWRLPTVAELLSTADYGSSPAYPAIFTRPSGANHTYWTATADAFDGSRAWAVDFADGKTSTETQSDLQFVRCVR